MTEPAITSIETTHGLYLVQGAGRFAISGDLNKEVAACVDDYFARHQAPPDAVVWDDAVLDIRPSNLIFQLLRVVTPPRDPFIAEALDSSARVAIRGAIVADTAHALDLNQVFSEVVAGRQSHIAHTTELLRFVGWPEAIPLRSTKAPAPRKNAKSISVVINYRDKSDTTITCLEHLKKQKLAAALEIILVDNQSAPVERAAVEEAAARLFAGNDSIHVVHLGYDAGFNHSAQCNQAVAISQGEALVMLSNDCLLLDPVLLQTIADWSLEPGAGTVGPRIIGDGGAIVCAGIAVVPVEDEAGKVKFRLQEAEVDYLSRIVRQSCGATFGCAAVSRSSWLAVGGADSVGLTNDYNDADFCLRLAKAGYTHLYVGTVEAFHQPSRGEERTRERTGELHDVLAARHPLEQVPARNPYTLPIKRPPSFNAAAANEISDFLRLYRLAVNARNAETPTVSDIGFLRAFEAIIAVLGGQRGPFQTPASTEEALDRRERLFNAMREVCSAYIRVGPAGSVPPRYLKSFASSANAFTRISAMAAGLAVPEPSVRHEPAPRSEPAAPHEPAPRSEASKTAPAKEAKGDFVSFADRDFKKAQNRLLVFADRFGDPQQIAFLHGLQDSRANGHTAVRIMCESDFARLRAERGSGGVAEYLRDSLERFRPTHCIYSHFSDSQSFAEIFAVLADFPEIARVFHAFDDVFAFPAVIDTDLYRAARHPVRVHTLYRIARSCDLILACSPGLAEILSERFGRRRVACLEPSVGGTPFVAERTAGPGVTIGYAASLDHQGDLELIAPALRRIKREIPAINIELAGEICAAQPATALKDVVVLRPETAGRYGNHCAALRAKGWDIGLAPLADTRFNSGRTPHHWAEYAQAGIVTIASDVAAYRELGRRGALVLAKDDAWYGRLKDLATHPERRHELAVLSGRQLLATHSWTKVEGAMLGLLGRAAALRRSVAGPSLVAI